jgi:hypothetical protein
MELPGIAGAEAVGLVALQDQFVMILSHISHIAEARRRYSIELPARDRRRHYGRFSSGRRQAEMICKSGSTSAPLRVLEQGDYAVFRHRDRAAIGRHGPRFAGRGRRYTSELSGIKNCHPRGAPSNAPV